MITPSKTILPDLLVRPESSTPLAASDAIAIHELLNRFYLAEDSRDLTALRQLVTDDFVQIHSLFGRLDGAEALANWVNDNPQFFDGIRHQAINVATHSTGADTAQAIGYILVFQLFGDEHVSPALPRIIGHGVVRDSLVRHDGSWRVSHRTYDQMSVLPAFAPDAEARQTAAQNVTD